MSASADRLSAIATPLRITQLAAVFQLELRRSFFGRRAMPAWVLAAIPVGIVILIRLLAGPPPLPRFSTVVAEMYQLLMLRVVLFFGCAWVFTNLFRGEMLERSLHYLFLAPVRREILVLGKWAAGVIGAAVLFGGSTIATYVILSGSAEGGLATNHFFEDGGVGALASYVAATLLGVVGYGALFLFLGVISKSPFIPALLVWGWENIHFLLPPFLKRITILDYLLAFCPVKLNRGIFAIISDPPSLGLAIPALIILSIASLAAAMWKVRHVEISYAQE